MKLAEKIIELSEGNKLIGSSTSLDGIKKLISDFWFGATISLDQLDDGTYQVSNSKGVVKGFKVVKKGKRFRFERE